jgi:hypothetical protein
MFLALAGFITLVLPPYVREVPRGETTLVVMKYYMIDRIKGGIRFTCTRCTHFVSTLAFKVKNGNLRTQAAASINQHATEKHEQRAQPASDAEQRAWKH